MAEELEELGGNEDTWATKTNADGETILGSIETEAAKTCNGAAASGTNAYVTCAGYEAAAQEQADAINQQWKVDVGIQVALALWDRKSSDLITGLQHKLASQQMTMAEEVHDHAKKFLPYENKFVQEAMSLAKFKPQYHATSSAWGDKLDSDLGEARNDFNQMMADMCIPIGRCMDARWLREAGLRSADIRNYALRQEENRAQALNDQRYSWQYSALGLGRGKIQTIQSYAELAGTVGMNAAKFLSAGLNGLGGVVSGWVMSAAPPKYSITDEPQKYMPTVRYEGTPVKPVPQKPCTKIIRSWQDNGFGTGGEYVNLEVPCDTDPSQVVSARG